MQMAAMASAFLWNSICLQEMLLSQSVTLEYAARQFLLQLCGDVKEGCARPVLHVTCPSAVMPFGAMPSWLL